MEHGVTLVDELRGDGLIVNAVDSVVESGVGFEVLNIFKCPGGEVVNDEDLIAALQVCIGQMRSDKSRSAGYQYAQTLCCSFWFFIHTWLQPGVQVSDKRGNRLNGFSYFRCLCHLAEARCE